MQHRIFKRWPLALITIVLWVAGIVLPGHGPLAGNSGIVLEKPVELSPFTLIDHHNKPFTLNNLEGKWTFIFLGYTHCPDVCPVTLGEMSKLVEVLTPKPPQLSQFQYIFVSVDPDRDTPEHLADYVKYFDSAITGVTGEKSELQKLTRQLKTKFSLGEGTKTEYGVNHSSALLLIDPQARYYGRFRAPHYVDKIYSQLRDIFKPDTWTTLTQ